MPQKKFIILFSARTGSNLLVDLLDRHPLISCDSELVVGRGQYAFAGDSFEQVVHNRMQQASKPVYGFKVSLYQLSLTGHDDDGQVLLSQLSREGWQFIYLYRDDVVRQSFSFAKASYTGVFHLHRYSDKPSHRIRVGIIDILRWLYTFYFYRTREERFISTIPHLRVNYEADLSEASVQQETIDRICDYLHIGHAAVTTDFIPTSDKTYYSDILYGRMLSAAARAAAMLLGPLAALSEKTHHTYDLHLSSVKKQYEVSID